jgi:hypothetical protein
LFTLGSFLLQKKPTILATMYKILQQIVWANFPPTHLVAPVMATATKSFDLGIVARLGGGCNERAREAPAADGPAGHRRPRLQQERQVRLCRGQFLKLAPP